MNPADWDAPSIRELLREAGRQQIERLEAELLLAHVLEQTRTHLHTWPEESCSSATVERFRALVHRRLQGEPIAYLVGHREFWSLDLKVSPDTLIPRPETELLVELALRQIPLDATWCVADLGTGSGALALSLAKERPNCRITATEHSPAALVIARANAARHAIGNVEFILGDWWQPLGDRRFHIALSNPPYIPDTDPHLQQGDLPWEPRAALASGADGLDAVRCIVSTACAHLRPGGWLLLEHGYDQGAAVRGLLQDTEMVDIETHRDLAAQDRATWCRYQGS